MGEPKPKKMVGRSVAITLGIICILLIAVVAYFSITGISAQNSYDNLQTQNKQLQAWLKGNETLLNQTQANNTKLTNQVNDLTNTLNLEKSTVWDNQTINQPTNSYTYMPFLVTYAGYVSVNVASSTSNTTYVEVIYNAHGISYDNTITVGTNGTATFPVLPPFPISSYTAIQFNSTVLSASLSNRPFPLPITATPYTNIEIRVGNVNAVDNATETVTITYYY